MEFDELNALKEIKAGKRLAEFPEEISGVRLPTDLMVLAALTWHKKDGYLEVPEGAWTERAAMIAVANNFRAIPVIPPKYCVRLAEPICEQSNRLTRKDLKDFMKILNEQDVDLLRRCRVHLEDISRFYTEKNYKATDLGKNRDLRQKYDPEKRLPVKKEDYTLDFSGNQELSDPDESTAFMFLSLPVQEKTMERLSGILNSDEDLPGDFIKRLSIPNRNAAFYEKNGDFERAAYWKSQIIPYLNLTVCRQIAARHPEGSLETKAYLTKEGVSAFWNRKKETCTKKELLSWFLKFPEEVLTVSMAQDLPYTAAVLSHAKSLFLHEEEFIRKVLNREPYEILNLPEYQTVKRLLAAGVPLNAVSILKIADERIREKIAVALNIPLTA